MKVRMIVDVSGTREGRDWPRRGSVIELPDAEAREYCDNHMAVPVLDFREERAVTPTEKIEARAVPPADPPAPARPALAVEPEPASEPVSSGLTTKTGPVRRGGKTGPSKAS